MSAVDFAKFVKNRLASLVSFDNTGTGFVSDNVQDAIVEAASAGDFLASVDCILVGQSFTIPIRRQMWVRQSIKIDGTLLVNGTLVVD